MILDDAYNNAVKDETIRVFAEDHAEKLICNRCGKEYVSRGIKDPGYCYECEEEIKLENAKFIGGPLGT